MTHIFDPKHFLKLDSPKRREILPIDLVIEHLQIRSHMDIADVGCGIGYFSFPFAEHANSVHAVDISDVMITELIKRNHYHNLMPHLGDFNEILKPESVDLFFTATVIHELDDITTFTHQAVKKLKPNGRLAYLDFHKKETGPGPSVEKRIASEAVCDLFISLGLKDIKTFDINHIFYLVVGRS